MAIVRQPHAWIGTKSQYPQLFQCHQKKVTIFAWVLSHPDNFYWDNAYISEKLDIPVSFIKRFEKELKSSGYLAFDPSLNDLVIYEHPELNPKFSQTTKNIKPIPYTRPVGNGIVGNGWCTYYAKIVITDSFDANGEPNDNGTFYKIGISKFGGEHRIKSSIKDFVNTEVKILSEIWFNNKFDAGIEELKVLRDYQAFAIKHKIFVLRSGNTEVFDRDVLGLDK